VRRPPLRLLGVDEEHQYRWRGAWLRTFRPPLLSIGGLEKVSVRLLFLDSRSICFSRCQSTVLYLISCPQVKRNGCPRALLFLSPWKRTHLDFELQATHRITARLDILSQQSLAAVDQGPLPLQTRTIRNSRLDARREAAVLRGRSPGFQRQIPTLTDMVILSPCDERKFGPKTQMCTTFKTLH